MTNAFAGAEPGSLSHRFLSPETLDALATVRDWLRFAVSRFEEAGLHYGHGTDNAWDEAVLLVLTSLHLPLTDNRHYLDARLTPAERRLLAERLQARVVERVPVPYITGEAWFCGQPFSVDTRVLIPRSPIGELLGEGVEPWLGERPVRRILDLCAGSGCIGLVAAQVFPDAEVELADLSEEALAVARSNIARYGLADRVRAIRSDLVESLQGPYDLLLSNPPYVDARDMESLPPEYRHEPAMALAAGDDGLDILRRMFAELPRVLAPGALLVIEVGNSQPAVEENWPDWPLTWLSFERGGEGVFVLEGDDLKALVETN